jgi:hypothetical protein
MSEYHKQAMLSGRKALIISNALAYVTLDRAVAMADFVEYMRWDEKAKIDDIRKLVDELVWVTRSFDTDYYGFVHELYEYGKLKNQKLN